MLLAALDEQMLDLISDYASGPLVFAVLMVLIAVLEWVKSYWSVSPAPWVYSLTAAFTVAYAVFRFVRVKREWETLRLGRDGEKADGEKAVGQKLEALRKSGYKVFHDIIGDGFSIDHVLIGPAGLFAVQAGPLDA